MKSKEVLLVGVFAVSLLFLMIGVMIGSRATPPLAVGAVPPGANSAAEAKAAPAGAWTTTRRHPKVRAPAPHHRHRSPGAGKSESPARRLASFDRSWPRPAQAPFPASWRQEITRYLPARSRSFASAKAGRAAKGSVKDPQGRHRRAHRLDAPSGGPPAPLRPRPSGAHRGHAALTAPTPPQAAIHRTRSTFDYKEIKKKRRLLLVKMNG